MMVCDECGAQDNIMFAKGGGKLICANCEDLLRAGQSDDWLDVQKDNRRWLHGPQENLVDK